MDIDAIGLFLLPSDGEKQVFTNLFAAKSIGEVQSIERIDPAKFIVKVKVDSPFFLVFHETYHQTWRASIGTKSYSSNVVDYFLNGFFINETGEATIMLTLGVDQSIQFSWKIGIILFILSLLISFSIDKIRDKRILH